mgnify:CR=1 FL=1
MKKSDIYTGLHKTTARRVYAILVEILENIAKHSIKKSSGALKPFISAEKSGGKVFIMAGNPLSVDKKEKLTTQLELVNNLDEEELTSFYEDKISRKTRKNENGAGLGFILMRLKSGNRLDFSFSEAEGNISYFTIQIAVNKYIMRKLSIEQTSNSPKVMLDPENNVFEIS